MNRTTTFLLLPLLSFVTGGSALSQELFSDDFNTDSSASYTTLTTSADTDVQFAFDYSALGIPSAPNTPDASTLGLRMAANTNTGAAAAATLATVEQFTGDYAVRFDAWINANGPFPGGGTGSTEFITAGVGSDASVANLGGTSGSGGWMAFDGEGGSSRDYRLYKNDGEQFPASGQFVAGNNHPDPLFASFGGIDVGSLPVQGAIPQQNGTTLVGSAGFNWRRVELLVDSTGGTGGATSMEWSIDGIVIGTLDAGIGSTFATDGSATIGYMDIFSSISDNAMLSFGLIDNLVVEVTAAKTVRIEQTADFAIVNEDGAMVTATFSIENRDTSPLTVNEVNLSGANSGDFAVATGLPVVIPAAGTGFIDITFTASGDRETKSAQVEFVSTDAQDPSLTFGLEAVFAHILLAHYKFDEADGSTVVEASGNGADGAYIARDPIGYSSLGLAGGTSIEFTAADSGTTGNFAIMAPLHVPTTSISMWIRPDTGAGGEDTLFNRDPGFTGADAIYGCFIDDGGTLTARTGGEVAVSSDIGAISDGMTHHVVITHLDQDGFGNETATRTRMYIDGALVGESNDPTGFDAYPANASTASLYVATRTAAGAGFDGLVDDLQIYSIELSRAQVANMFSAPGVTAFDPLPELAITGITYNPDTLEGTITFDSLPGVFYFIEHAGSLDDWEEFDDSVESQGFSTTYSFTASPENGSTRFYRVRPAE